MSVSMPMSFFDQLAIAGKSVAAETTKRAVLAARAIAKEAPQHISQAHQWANQAGKVIAAEAPKGVSAAQSFAVAAARVVGAEAPKGFVVARRIGGKAARVVVAGAPKGAVAVSHLAGRVAKAVVAETPRRFQAARQFTTSAAKVVVAETPKRMTVARNTVVEAVKKGHVQQYGKTLAGSASIAVHRVARVAVKSTITVVTVSFGFLAVAGSKILSYRLPAASGAKDKAGGSAVDPGIEMAAAEENSTVPQVTAADRHRQAVVQGADQIVKGAIMAVSGLLGMVGRSLSQTQQAKEEKDHTE